MFSKNRRANSTAMSKPLLLQLLHIMVSGCCQYRPIQEVNSEKGSAFGLVEDPREATSGGTTGITDVTGKALHFHHACPE